MSHLGFLHLHDVGLTVCDAVVDVVNVGCQCVHFLVQRKHRLLCLWPLPDQSVPLPDDLFFTLGQLLSLLWDINTLTCMKLDRTSSRFKPMELLHEYMVKAMEKQRVTDSPFPKLCLGLFLFCCPLMMTMTHATTRWLGKTEFSLFKYHRLQIWHQYMSAAPSPTSATLFSSFSNARSFEFRRELNRKLLTTETQSIHVYTSLGAFGKIVNAKVTCTSTVYVVWTGLTEKQCNRISRIPDITY